jgi:hypothetical protein
MADIAKEHNLFIIGDEVYREFVYGGEPLMSLLQLEGYEENVVVIDSMSKRFSACGARIGCVISRNKELMAQAMKWCQGRLCSATIDQVGSAALYTVGPEYFAAVRDEYRDRRDALVAGLKKIPGVVYSEPKGAFYVMAALPVDDADKFQKWLLTDFDLDGDTVMFAPAESFYETPHHGVNEIRMAYVIKKPDLERAMEPVLLCRDFPGAPEKGAVRNVGGAFPTRKKVLTAKETACLYPQAPLAPSKRGPRDQVSVKSPSFTQPALRHIWLMRGHRTAGRTKQIKIRPAHSNGPGTMATAPLARAASLGLTQPV